MLKGDTIEEKVWNYLLFNINNEFGVAGLMGNLYAESGLKSTNLQNSFEKKLNMSDEAYTIEVDTGLYDNFINDKAGYGIAQWTYNTRKQALLEYAMKQGVSIGNLQMQLDFLIKELQSNFKQVWNGLIFATSVKEASNLVLTKFEKPSDQSTVVKNKRAEYSQNFYNNFKNAKSITTTQKNFQTYPITITQNNGITNTTYKYQRPIEYIVIHYTAGTTSQSGSAINLANAARNNNISTSAEFYVDDTTIVQYISEIENRYSWSVGGNKYTTMSTSLGGKFYGKCTNTNSINIEICNEKINKKSYKNTDTDWYFTDAAVNNAIGLTRYLMDKYNIDIEHVIMHHQVTGKCCPYPWTYNETALKGWRDFLSKVENAKPKVTVTTKVSVNSKNSNNAEIKNETYNAAAAFLITINCAALNVRKGPDISYSIVSVIKDKNKYTIVEEKNGWGKLKSGLGWINLKYTKKI